MYGDFFQELDQLKTYLDIPRDAVSFLFEPDENGHLDASVLVFSSGNSVQALVDQYGLPNLYHACDRAISVRRLEGEERFNAFERWLVETPVEEIKGKLPIKPLEQLAVSR